MSNLIKSVYFNMDPSKAKVIDSDQQVESFIPHFFSQETTDDPQTSLQDGMTGTDTAEEDAGFQGGMSVLNMEDIRQEEREKISRESEQQVLQLKEEAQAEAAQILEAAKTEAEQIRQEAYAEGFARGKEEGVEEGRTQLSREREAFAQQMQQEKAQLQEAQDQLEPQFAQIVATLIGKITGVVCEDKKAVIVYLIHQALHQLGRTSHITVRVSREDLVLVNGKKKLLQKAVPDGVELQIQEDSSLTQSQCIIEADDKMIDCSLDVQLQNVQEQIKLLSLM